MFLRPNSSQGFHPQQQSLVHPQMAHTVIAPRPATADPSTRLQRPQSAGRLRPTAFGPAPAPHQPTVSGPAPAHHPGVAGPQAAFEQMKKFQQQQLQQIQQQQQQFAKMMQQRQQQFVQYQQAMLKQQQKWQQQQVETQQKIQQQHQQQFLAAAKKNAAQQTKIATTVSAANPTRPFASSSPSIPKSATVTAAGSPGAPVPVPASATAVAPKAQQQQHTIAATQIRRPAAHPHQQIGQTVLSRPASARAASPTPNPFRHPQQQHGYPGRPGFYGPGAPPPTAAARGHHHQHPSSSSSSQQQQKQPLQQPSTIVLQSDVFVLDVAEEDVADDNPLLQQHRFLISEMRHLGILHGERLVVSENDSLIIFKKHVDTIRRLHSWAIPTETALQTIAKFSPHGVLELGAGTGYWAALLTARRVDVVAFDDTPLDGEKMNGSQAILINFHLATLNLHYEYSDNPPTWFKVQKGSVEQLEKHPDRTLLMCWTPPEESDYEGVGHVSNYVGAKSVCAFKGEYIIYVGEWLGSTCGSNGYGATGGAVMQKLLETHFDLVERVLIPNWPPAKDKLMVWKRKPGHNEITLGKHVHEKREPQEKRGAEGQTFNSKIASATVEEKTQVRNDIITSSKIVLDHEYCSNILLPIIRSGAGEKAFSVPQLQAWRRWLAARDAVAAANAKVAGHAK